MNRSAKCAETNLTTTIPMLVTGNVASSASGHRNEQELTERLIGPVIANAISPMAIATTRTMSFRRIASFARGAEAEVGRQALSRGHPRPPRAHA
jgi:hypothetical protein